MRKNFSYLALLHLQSSRIPRKDERLSVNVGNDTNFFAHFALTTYVKHVTARRPQTMRRPREVARDVKRARCCAMIAKIEGHKPIRPTEFADDSLPGRLCCPRAIQEIL